MTHTRELARAAGHRTGRRAATVAALLSIAALPASAAARTPSGQAPKAHASSTHSLRHYRRAAKKRVLVGSVHAVQVALGIHADGVFGPGTLHALRAFQRAHGLTPDGVVGRQTWNALRQAYHHGSHPRAAARHRRRARAGRRHNVTLRHYRHAARKRVLVGSVHAVQVVLGIPADGVFGPETLHALRAFQRSHGLTPDGVVGPATWNALRQAYHHGGGSTTSGTPSVIARVIAAGNRIATLPYIWGGGHGSWSAAGYDCSGSVSYALHGGGLLSRPLDSSQLESYGDPGPGRHITIYANASHAFMIVDGRRFDTSALSSGGSRWTRASRSTAGFVVRHPRGY